MMRTYFHRMALGLVLLTATAAYAESHLMRMADIHGEQVVFTYEDDLWLASTAGGPACRITSDPGTEAWAKFSPDGQWIAFSAQYDGGADVYVMPVTGGAPRRLTYHPASDRVLDWWPDGQSILFRSRREYPLRGEEVYRVALDGGLDEKLPVDRAGLASVSPDGTMIAYNRISRESSTWKRHRGGTAQDIWLGSFEKRDYRKVVDTDWTDNFPMWQGAAVYFASDREFGTLNIHRYDVRTGQVTRLTGYTDYDVKYPSQGPGAIIYQYAETLHVLDLESGRTRALAIEIPTDGVRMRPEFVSISPSTGSFGLSPTGKRVLLEARGEIINLPAEKGEWVNLTRTSGSREKEAAWSPDGRWIAFLSDQTGEEEIYLVDQKGEQPWKQLTKDGLGFRMPLVWSPDSRHLAFSDKFMRLNVVDAATGEITVADQCDYDDAWERWGIQEYAWSPCSQWIAYTKMERSMNESLFVYSLKDKEVHRLTSDLTNDWSPSFSRDGKYLYFLSGRVLEPLMGAIDQNHIFLDVARPYVMLLQADAEHPFAPPKNPEEEVKEEKKEEAKKDDSNSDAGAEKPAEEPQADEAKKDDGTRIDFDGLDRRIVAAKGVSNGNYFRLEATKKGFMYLVKPEPEFQKYQTVNDRTGGSLDLYHYDLKEAETTKVLGGIANYHQSADGEKLIYRAGSRYGVVNVGSKVGVGDGKVEYDDVRLELDRSQEFMQMFNEAWRIERDWFYDPDMHGLDWVTVGAQYRKFVPFCGDRSDLNYLIGEMIGELNIGHTYVWGGDIAYNAKDVPTGLLGCDFARVPDVPFYRIAHIVPNNPSDPGERSPLDEPGCAIKAGDYLIAIDGTQVTTTDSPYRLLQNKRGEVVTVTYNDKPLAEGAKTYRLRTIGDEGGIRYRAWVEHNRAYVDKVTGGQVGYVHIPDMGEDGLTEFARYWYPQYYRKAFIVDVRYNGGGFTGDMIIDRIERQVWGISKPREGKTWRDPERAFAGPWVVLINEDTGSNGEMFAEAIKIRKMAPVIGMRTWGGSIGIEAHQDLVDGGAVTPPQFGLYGLDRRWLIEGRGVEPDIEVQNMPGEVLSGVDSQLDAAIQNLQRRIPTEGFEDPPPPTYPNKAKPAGS